MKRICTQITSVFIVAISLFFDVSLGAELSFLDQEIEHYTQLADTIGGEGVGSILASTKYIASLPIADELNALIASIYSAAFHSIIIIGVNGNFSKYTCDVFFRTGAAKTLWSHRVIDIDLNSGQITLTDEIGLPANVLGAIPDFMRSTTGVYSPVRGHDLGSLQATYYVAETKRSYRCGAYGFIPDLSRMTIPGRIGMLAWVLVGIAHETGARQGQTAKIENSHSPDAEEQDPSR